MLRSLIVIQKNTYAERGIFLASVETTKTGTSIVTRLVAVILLLGVSYIHLVLIFKVMGFNHTLAILFMLNTVGAIVALIGVLRDARWMGWGFGIVMAGGAALIRTAMNSSPSVTAFVMGKMSKIHGVDHAIHGHATSVIHKSMGFLPAIPNADPVSLVIEYAFVIIAIFALISISRHQQHPMN